MTVFVYIVVKYSCYLNIFTTNFILILGYRLTITVLMNSDYLFVQLLTITTAFYKPKTFAHNSLEKSKTLWAVESVCLDLNHFSINLVACLQWPSCWKVELHLHRKYFGVCNYFCSTA